MMMTTMMTTMREVVKFLLTYDLDLDPQSCVKLGGTAQVRAGVEDAVLISLCDYDDDDQ